MKRTFYSAILILSTSGIMSAQSNNARVNALVASSIQSDKTADPNFAVFRTMESVRHGMLPGLRGVQVKVDQPICEGQTGGVALVNESGEAWKYKIIDRNGPLIQEGDVGYNRRIGNLNNGAYLIQFTLANGTSVIDEFTIRRGKGLQATITSESPVVVSGQPIKFTAEAQGATEFTWDFGDGSTAFGEATIEHTFKSQGSYNITLIANNFDCKAEAYTSITVAGEPAAVEKGE
jgi:hypothetical protein